MSKGKPIGLIGGAFDPVHVGHVHLARECAAVLDLQEVRFIPANVPPHKAAAVAAAHHRLAMLERASAPHPELAVSAMELSRGGTSYTIDTLAELRAAAPRQSFCFIMGADAFATLPAWRRWQELAEYAHLVIIDRNRPDNRPWEAGLQAYYAARAGAAPADLRMRPCGSIHRAAVSVPEVSSSLARAMLRRGARATDLLPPGVYDYIKENRLYQ